MKPKILIIDDDERNAALLKTRLERDGFDTVTALDGVDGIAKVYSSSPDLILMDVTMPKMDGYEVLRVLKSRDDTRYIPIIMQTGRTEISDKLMGLEYGAEDYISKPYSLQEVSARVKALLKMRALQNRLHETEKMAALGEMVDGIAHELRNPLTTIGGMARRLYESEVEPQHKVYASNIMKSVKRLERMCQRIDEYKRVLVSTLAKGDINGVIAESLKDADEFIEASGKDVRIRTSLHGATAPLKLDAGNMRIAIFNILQNSVEAISEKGEITIETSLIDGKDFLIKITDTGVGINKDDMRKIFSPFQTSKIEGSGMGLTITYRIIQDHGGEIEVESEQGKGTAVSIKLHRA